MRRQSGLGLQMTRYVAIVAALLSMTAQPVLAARFFLPRQIRAEITEAGELTVIPCPSRLTRADTLASDTVCMDRSVLPGKEFEERFEVFLAGYTQPLQWKAVGPWRTIGGNRVLSMARKGWHDLDSATFRLTLSRKVLMAEKFEPSGP